MGLVAPLNCRIGHEREYLSKHSSTHKKASEWMYICMLIDVVFNRQITFDENRESPATAVNLVTTYRDGSQDYTLLLAE